MGRTADVFYSATEYVAQYFANDFLYLQLLLIISDMIVKLYKSIVLILLCAVMKVTCGAAEVETPVLVSADSLEERYCLERLRKCQSDMESQDVQENYDAANLLLASVSF